jgi:predicted HTH transcriptional regulator
MEQGMAQSKLRNPILANLPRDVPGHIERIGSGVRFMIDETKRLGLPAPEFREMSEFVVTFRHASSLTVFQPQPQPPVARTLWDDDEQLRSTVSIQEKPGEPEQRMVKAVEYVNEHGSITNTVYRELTGVSDRTAHRDLETLVERGRLKGIGQKQA